ncbi:PspC domain-containing protein [Lactobacillus kefiranofaciens]|uniref:Phage shock protein C (PspC) family protein n=1 Tax=Lactobacillus kefiranofaciens TaxID=267818 RepID=A0AAX3UH02_9LACO|nr:PspC domain-containing protein [Lactobacillus kefiranofaciens]AEG39879.1 Stress-responsive transcriptional regulator PspC [Lactobacillus kefiranofaciens subsp. kefiranofaciens]KRM21917.1 stress-responsive transcriptional regulator PspC [Lactobacillus kefiranofaciens subsp. kefiranofaciens DSM 5016 = JCM 6985]WGO86769.1 PspC domain-containing protein [Lactobacillus kefiranofaciens]WQH35914.1 PspC domain-containing protein [Lactobacillus kefiranofaciens]SDA50416.1 phage shock protein C (PspC)
MQKRLTKSSNKILAGVFGGIANYFQLDPAWVRIIGAALILFTGIFPGVALYIIAAMVMPEPGENAPKAEKKGTDYQTDRPNTMDGDFTKKPEEGQSDNTKDGSSEN